LASVAVVNLRCRRITGECLRAIAP
jgi:hypothetical protein